MNLALRKLVVVFFSLWLPLSAVAAAMMPLCAHENAKQMHASHAAEQGSEQHRGCPEQGADDDVGAVGECAHCGLCIFAATPWLPGTQFSFDAFSSVAVVEGIFPPLHSLVLPPADRPPLATA